MALLRCCCCCCGHLLLLLLWASPAASPATAALRVDWESSAPSAACALPPPSSLPRPCPYLWCLTHPHLHHLRTPPLLQTDLPAAEVRRLLGPSWLLGVSVKTVEQAWAAQAAGADYLGCGAGAWQGGGCGGLNLPCQAVLPRYYGRTTQVLRLYYSGTMVILLRHYGQLLRYYGHTTTMAVLLRYYGRTIQALWPYYSGTTAILPRYYGHTTQALRPYYSGTLDVLLRYYDRTTQALGH